MKITKKSLVKILEILLSKVFINSYNEIEMLEDFYWNIPDLDLYNIKDDPKELTLGQLSDDWQELVKILEKENAPTKYDLAKLSSVLRYLSSLK
ncbi:MAG: hypothetical protein ACRYF0_06445 [Janthinobacterium lividum]